MPRKSKKLWPAGEYTLLATSYTAEDGLTTHSKGDTLTLGGREATRLWNAGAGDEVAGCQGQGREWSGQQAGRVPPPDVGAGRGLGRSSRYAFSSVSVSERPCCGACTLRRAAGCCPPCCYPPSAPRRCSRTTPIPTPRTRRIFPGLATTRASSPKQPEAAPCPAPRGPDVLWSAFARRGPPRRRNFWTLNDRQDALSVSGPSLPPSIH
jgi:hypothetical protein